ncbi:MAG: RNA-binding protein [Candidatus Aenigmarchaeota archaeon]|nr:RNA-binding protein [Candidatus Aenigmarchaeota archaeon]
MEEKQGYVIVTPGTLLATLKKSGEGTFILNGKTYSKYFGIKREGYRISVIPFNQSYKPKRGDKIIGKIKDFNYPFFIIDIEAPNPAYLHLMDISRYNTRQEQIMKIYKPGLWIYSEVSELSDRVRLSMKFRESKILSGGRIAYISPSKVPRVVGKGGSMIKMIQDKTKCKVLIGQNGIVWINGDNTGLVIKIIQKIDKEAHISGLTDRVSQLIDRELNYGKT